MSQPRPGGERIARSGAPSRRLLVCLILDRALLRPRPEAPPVPAFRRLIADTQAIDAVLLRLIEYAETAELIADPAVPKAPPTPVELGGRRADAGVSACQRSLGGALSLLNTALDRDALQRGDHAPDQYQPLVFILAGDPPDDDWEGPAFGVRTLAELKFLNVFGFAFGDTENTLLRITPTVCRASGQSAFADCLDWISRTVETTARLAPRASERNKRIRAPSLPPTLRRVRSRG